MRIGIIHPDLGIGGAERLIVDAALGLQSKGHRVDIYTSYHDPHHSFKETNDGTLNVKVLGNTFPTSIFGYFHLLCAIIRQFHLASVLCLSIFIHFIFRHFSVNSSSFDAYHRWFYPTKPYDVILIDQLSASVPFLRLFIGCPVVFYCHFPDKLLASGDVAPVSHDGKQVFNAPINPLKAIYRIPMDKFEDVTTADADTLIANSNFTANVVEQSFTSIRNRPLVIYPSVDMEEIEKPHEKFTTSYKMFLSINRFEPKKNVNLAINSYANLIEKLPNNERSSLKLILAGGYDPRLISNVNCVENLEKLCQKLELKFTSIKSLTELNDDVDVYFMLNVESKIKKQLLSSTSTVALLYTPTNEHFGIVPVEAMGNGLPVIATNSGGPRESIIDGTTGYLKDPNPSVWSESMLLLWQNNDRNTFSLACKDQVKKHFTQSAAADAFSNVLTQTATNGLVDDCMFARLMISFILLGSAVTLSVLFALIAL